MHHLHRRTAAFATLASLALPLMTSQAAELATLDVPGTSDLWLAGMPDGSTASSGDSAPAHSPQFVAGLTLAPGDVLTFSAAGCAAHGPTQTLVGPDGGTWFSHVGALNGISNLRARLNAVIGVFLSDAQPDLAAAPDTLNFESLGTDFVEFAPQLQQSFVIGDGASDGGQVHEFVVPAGATRLFIGTHDGFGWFNNIGSHTVTVAQAGDFDADGDGIHDVVDNCTLNPNPDQTDADEDGFGNACDADLNNDGIVNVLDLGQLRLVFFTDDANADLNADGVVNVTDLGIFRTLFFAPPGPAAAPVDCTQG